MADFALPSASQPIAGRSRARIIVRRVLIGVGVLLLAVMALAAAAIGPLLLEPNRYEGTASIELR